MAETIGEVVVNIRGNSEGFAEDAAKNAAEEVGGAGKTAGGKFTNWFKKSAKKAMKFGAVAVGAAAGAAILGGVKSAVDQQKSEKILAGLYGNADEASSMMKRLNDIASDSPLRVSTFSKGAETLAYAGIKGDDAAKALENVGKAVTVAGGGQDEFQRSMDGVLGMVNKGKVDLQGLNRVADAGIPILSGLADHFGVSIEDVNQMATDGKIALEDVMDVLKEGKGLTFQQMLGSYDDAMTAVTMIAKQTWGNIQDTIGQRLQPLLEKLSPIIQGVAEGAVPAVNAIFDAFDKVADVLMNVASFVSENKTAFTVLGSILGTLAVTIGGVVLATKAWAIASTLLNKAMNANPFVRILTILLALGAGFVALYKKSETFRNIVDGAMSAIGKAFSALWEAASPILEKIGNWFGEVIPPVLEWFKDTIGTAWDAISTGLSAAWEFVQPILSTLFSWIGERLPAVFSVLKTVAKIYFLPLRLAFEALWEIAKFVFNSIKAVIETVVAPVISWLWTTIVKPLFGLIGTFIKTTWDGIIKPVFTAIKTVIETVVAPVIKWLYNTIVKPIWQAIATFIDTMWEGGIKVTFKALQTFVKDVLSAVFNAFLDLIKRVWNGIKTAINVVWAFIRDKIFKPIKDWAANTLTGAFNTLKKLVKLYIEGWRLVISTAWNFVRDKVFAPLKNLVTKTIPTSFNTMKNGVSTAMGKFKTAISTPYNWVKDHAFTPLKNLITKTVPNAFKQGVKSVKTQWGKIKNAFKTPINAVINAYNGSLPKLWNPIAGIIGKDNWKLDKVPTFAKGGKVWGAGTTTSDSIPARLSRDEHVLTAKDVDNLGGHRNVYGMRAAAARGDVPGFAGGGAVWKNLWKINKGKFPDSRRTSDVRNTTTVSGNPSLHNTGNAVDVAAARSGDKSGMMKIFNWWRKNYGSKLAELIHTPAGSKQIKNGKNHTYGGAVAAQHYDHVHIAARKALNGKGGLGGLADMLPGIGKFKALKDKFKNIGGGKLGKVMSGMGTKMISGMASKATGLFDKMGDVVTGAKEGIQKGWSYAKGQAWAGARGLSNKNRKHMNWIVSQESGWDENAKNPSSTASGLPQFINATSREYLGGAPARSFGAWKQLDGMRKYVSDRYNGWAGAERYWRAHNYYAKGGAVGSRLSERLRGSQATPRMLNRDKGGSVPPGRHVIDNQTGKDEYVLPPRATKALTEGNLSTGDSGDITIQVNLNMKDLEDVTSAVEFVEKLKKTAKNDRVRSRMTANSGEVDA